MAEHRVSMLRSSLRRRTDPAHSRDPRIRAVVAQLAELQVTAVPDAQFRSELRAQLVAIAPRIVAESRTAEVERPGQHQAGIETKAPAAVPAKHADARGRRIRIPIMRPLRIVTAVLAVFALLLGGAVWMSRKALPGDSLYGLKRAGEQVELSLAGSDRERAQDRLDFARTRVDEVRDLWSRSTSTALGRGPNAAGAPSAQSVALIDDTLASADSDVTAAAQLLNSDAVRTHSATPLQTMTQWAPGQLARLRAIAAALPQGALRSRAASSTDLVAAAATRSAQLRSRVDCSCMRGARADKLGPLPCTVCTGPASAPKHTGGTSTGTSSRPGGDTGPAATRRHSGSTAPAPPGTARTGRHATTSPAPKTTPSPRGPVLPIPLPTKVPVPKVSVGKCISVSAGPISIGIGDCPHSK